MEEPPPSEEEESVKLEPEDDEFQFDPNQELGPFGGNQFRQQNQ